MIEKLAGIGSVFMLHRVCPYDPGAIIYNENMKLSPEELENIIQTQLEKKNVFVSLDEMIEIVKSRKKYSTRFIAITLDDGYKDNLVYGYPIFKKYGVPFCIYVTTSFPDRTTDLWWYALEQLVLNNDVLLSTDGEPLSNLLLDEKQRNFLKFRSMVLSTYYRDPASFFKTVGSLHFDLAVEREEKCLSWDEIKKLQSDPLVTIGSHTVNHLPLSRLAPEEVEREIYDANISLEKYLGRPVRHFAFPFGGRQECSVREYQIAKGLGFDSIATTIFGHIYRRDNVHELNRIFVYPLKNNATTLDKILFWNPRSYYSIAKKNLPIFR
jgi:peptidoglycan/xylan/chitin deacetylase (PgdA/CDA1 family)